MGRTIGGLFLLVKGYLDRKQGAGDAIGKGRWSGGRPFEKSAHLLVESPVKRAFEHNSGRPLPAYHELLDGFYEEYQVIIVPQQYRAAKDDPDYFLVLIKLTCYHEEQENVDKGGAITIILQLD